MSFFPLTAIVTILTVLLLFAIASLVGLARAKYGVHAPATTGNENFERMFRVHANTVENTVIFLPVLWLFAATIGDRWAALLGLVWLVGRVWYAAAYAQDAKRRGSGFTVALAAWVALTLGAAIGLVRVWL